MSDEFLHELLPVEDLDNSQPQSESESNPIDKIQSLINQWSLDQPMNMQEYIIADDKLIVTEIPMDEKIIVTVMNCDCDKPEEIALEPVS